MHYTFKWNESYHVFLNVFRIANICLWHTSESAAIMVLSHAGRLKRERDGSPQVPPPVHWHAARCAHCHPKLLTPCFYRSAFTSFFIRKLSLEWFRKWSVNKPFEILWMLAKTALCFYLDYFTASKYPRPLVASHFFVLEVSPVHRWPFILLPWGSS